MLFLFDQTKTKVPVNYDLPRQHPAKFADLLINRLKPLKKKQDMGEKLFTLLRDMEVSIITASQLNRCLYFHHSTIPVDLLFLASK